jgi:phytoene synthase
VSDWPEPLAQAYATCGATARAYDAKCPVRLWLLPKAMRPHVAAIYAYAAIAGDIADRRTEAPVERLALLDAWQQRLHAAVDGKRSERAPHAHEDGIVVALAHSIRSLDLPVPLADDLVSAFGQDTMTARYDSWAEVYDYCRRAANPFGRLMLNIAGYRDEALAQASDAFCTAMHLTSLWQDFSRDWIIGRLYVPRDVTAACRAREMDLQALFLNESWDAAIRRCMDETRAQFERGRALCDGVSGRLRYERRLTWLGGLMLLEKIEQAGPSIRSTRPVVGAGHLLRLLWRARQWRAQRP